MTAVKEYILHCDYGGCGDWIRCARKYGAEPTLAASRKWARKQGWRTVKTKTMDTQVITHDRCPRHKP